MLLWVTGNSIYLPSVLVRTHHRRRSPHAIIPTLKKLLSIHKQCRAFIYTTHDALPLILDQRSTIVANAPLGDRLINTWNKKNQTYSAAVQVVTQDAVFLSFVSYDIMTGRLKNCNCNERFKTGLRVLQESYDACRCRARGPTAVEALLLYRQACHGDKARTTCLHYISCRTANQDRRT